MILQEILNKTITFFKDKKIETPRIDAELLIASALGMRNRIDLYVQFERSLQEPEVEKCRDFVRRRTQGEPVAYILGSKGFMGHSFVVTPAVLIPRPETELLVEEAISFIVKNKIENPRILDLGTGTGCIGLSMAKRFPSAKVVLVEASQDAVKIAQKNAEALEVAAQVEILHQKAEDCQFANESFDVILSNPPYIANNDPEIEASVKKFEPSMALFSEDNGFNALKTWSEKAKPWLAPVGFMGFEMGYTQSSVMKEHFQSFQIFSSIKIIHDLAGLDRHIVGVRHG